jgi:hypothetical protein
MLEEECMKKNEVLSNIVKFVLLLLIVITSLLVYHFIRDYDILVRGILGLAVVYFIFRLHYLPLKSSNMFFELVFPGLLTDVIYGFFICIALYLAFDQLLKVFSWLIKVL